MEIIKALIVDDERFARKRFQQILSGKSDIEVIQYCTNGSDAIETIKSEKPDLVFLDIEMTDSSGFDVINSLDKKEKPYVIFVSGHQSYAVDAFEVNALDYIQKPITEERVMKSIDRAKVKMGIQSFPTNSGSENVDSNNLESKCLERYVVKNGNKITVLKIQDIMWIEADGNYVNLVTSQKKYLVRSTLSGFQSKLQADKFFRIHKSCVINIDFVECFEQELYGDYSVSMRGGEILKMSRNYSSVLKNI